MSPNEKYSGGRGGQEKNERGKHDFHTPSLFLTQRHLRAEDCWGLGKSQQRRVHSRSLTSRTQTSWGSERRQATRDAFSFPQTRAGQAQWAWGSCLCNRAGGQGEKEQWPNDRAPRGSQAHCLGWSFTFRPLPAETKAGLSIPASPGKTARPLTQSLQQWWHLMLALQRAAEAALPRQPKKAKPRGINTVISRCGVRGGPKKKQSGLHVPERKVRKISSVPHSPQSPSPSLLTSARF